MGLSLFSINAHLALELSASLVRKHIGRWWLGDHWSMNSLAKEQFQNVMKQWWDYTESAEMILKNHTDKYGYFMHQFDIFFGRSHS